jgi:hypothetical protein
MSWLVTCLVRLGIAAYRAVGARPRILRCQVQVRTRGNERQRPNSSDDEASETLISHAPRQQLAAERVVDR